MLGNRYSKSHVLKMKVKTFLDFFCRLNDSLNDFISCCYGSITDDRNKKINEATQAEDQRSAEILNICQSIKHSAKLKDAGIEVDCKTIV